MAEGSAEEALEASILEARNLSVDGMKAVYDLTSGTDFSKPRLTAEAIARVVWEQDVESWWTWRGTEPVFKPSRKVGDPIVARPTSEGRKGGGGISEGPQGGVRSLRRFIPVPLDRRPRGLVPNLLPGTTLGLSPPARGEPAETERGARWPLRPDGGLLRGRGPQFESLRHRRLLRAHGPRAPFDRGQHDERRAARRPDLRPHIDPRDESDQPRGARDEGESVRPRHGDLHGASRQGRSLQSARATDASRMGGRRDRPKLNGSRPGVECSREATRRRPVASRRRRRGARRSQGIWPRAHGRRPLRRAERSGDGIASLRGREETECWTLLHGPRSDRVPAARRVPAGHGPACARAERQSESTGSGSDLRSWREEFRTDGEVSKGRHPARFESRRRSQEDRNRPGHRVGCLTHLRIFGRDGRPLSLRVPSCRKTYYLSHTMGRTGGGGFRNHARRRVSRRAERKNDVRDD